MFFVALLGCLFSCGVEGVQSELQGRLNGEDTNENSEQNNPGEQSAPPVASAPPVSTSRDTVSVVQFDSKTFLEDCNSTNYELSYSIDLLLRSIEETSCQEALPKLEKSRTLKLSDPEMKDLSFLRSFKQLTTLYIWDLSSESTGWDSIQGLTGLSTFHLRGIQKKDLNFISPLVNLSELVISLNDEVQELNFLGDFEKLQTLRLWRLPSLTSVQTLEKTESLIYFSAISTGITDLSPLTKHTQLEKVFADRQEIVNCPQNTLSRFLNAFCAKQD